MLQLHRVQIDTVHLTKDVTVLAMSKEAACQAASKQAGPIIGVTYLGLSEGVVLGDAPWQMAEGVEIGTAFGNYGGS